MIDKLFELGIRAGSKKAHALKNVIFAFLVSRFSRQLRFAWSIPGDDLSDYSSARLEVHLRDAEGRDRFLSVPGRNLQPALVMFVTRGKEPKRFQRSESPPDHPEARLPEPDPELDHLWQELLEVIGPEELSSVWQWLKLPAAQREEASRWVPQRSAAA